MIAALWVLTVLLAGVASIGVLWVLWAALNDLIAPYEHEVLPGPARKLAVTLYAVGYLWDAYCNIVWCTLLFVELPHEITVSARLQRWVTAATGWRSRLALWVSVNMVNPLAYGGDHIHLPKE